MFLFISTNESMMLWVVADKKEPKDAPDYSTTSSNIKNGLKKDNNSNESKNSKRKL